VLLIKFGTLVFPPTSDLLTALDTAAIIGLVASSEATSELAIQIPASPEEGEEARPAFAAAKSF
jgi:hypothetical protein